MHNKFFIKNLDKNKIINTKNFLMLFLFFSNHSFASEIIEFLKPEVELFESTTSIKPLSKINKDQLNAPISIMSYDEDYGRILIMIDNQKYWIESHIVRSNQKGTAQCVASASPQGATTGGSRGLSGICK